MSAMARILFHPCFLCNQILPPLLEAFIGIFKEILITCLATRDCPSTVAAILNFSVSSCASRNFGEVFLFPVCTLSPTCCKEKSIESLSCEI